MWLHADSKISLLSNWNFNFSMLIEFHSITKSYPNGFCGIYMHSATGLTSPGKKVVSVSSANLLAIASTNHPAILGTHSNQMQ